MGCAANVIVAAAPLGDTFVLFHVIPPGQYVVLSTVSNAAPYEVQLPQSLCACCQWHRPRRAFFSACSIVPEKLTQRAPRWPKPLPAEHCPPAPPLNP